MTVYLTLTTAGSDSDSFSLYSNINGYTVPFELNVSRASLLAGYTTALVPDYTSVVRIKSTGDCINYTDIVLEYTPFVECLSGLIIETIYLNNITDLALLPINYTHPCPSTINTHYCNRALFEINGNGIYIGDSKLNNARGTGGTITSHGTYICQDYLNTPDLLVGGTWTGDIDSRYNKIVLTDAQAIALANISTSSLINFSLISTMVEYSTTCDAITVPHTNVTWIRISRPSGEILYNGCPVDNIATIDVCATPTTTSTTTTSTTSTTTTCNPTPNWITNGLFICVGFDKYAEEIDTNPCSPTYNTTRTGSLIEVNSTYCGYVPPPSFITVNNTSSGGAIFANSGGSNISVNSVNVTDIVGAPGGIYEPGDSGTIKTTQTGTYTIVIPASNSNGALNLYLKVIDSTGATISCQTVPNTGGTPVINTYTFNSVVIDDITNVQILMLDAC